MITLRTTRYDTPSVCFGKILNRALFLNTVTYDQIATDQLVQPAPRHVFRSQTTGFVSVVKVMSYNVVSSNLRPLDCSAVLELDSVLGFSHLYATLDKSIL